MYKLICQKPADFCLPKWLWWASFFKCLYYLGCITLTLFKKCPSEKILQQQISAVCTYVLWSVLTPIPICLEIFWYPHFLFFCCLSIGKFLWKVLSTSNLGQKIRNSYCMTNFELQSYGCLNLYLTIYSYLRPNIKKNKCRCRA